MKFLSAFMLLSSLALTQSQAPLDTPSTAAPASPRSIGYFGLAYPLSNDWIGTTKMMRRKIAADNSSHAATVLLSAIEIPKNSNALLHPFFTLFALDHSGTDCKAYLEASTSGIQDEKIGKIQQFSAAGYDYYRIDYELPNGVRYHSAICRVAQNYLLVWTVGAPERKGLDTVVSTLSSIAPVPPDEEAKAKLADSAPESKKVELNAVHVASGVTRGLKIKDARPVYPPEARSAYIQGTVVLEGKITTAGDLEIVEVIDGPMELIGSAVNATRQWKYRPYLLKGNPVEVLTELQVNYQLRR